LDEVADVDHTDVIGVRGNAVLFEKPEPAFEVSIVLIDGVVAESTFEVDVTDEVFGQQAKFHASFLAARITVL